MLCFTYPLILLLFSYFLLTSFTFFSSTCSWETQQFHAQFIHDLTFKNLIRPFLHHHHHHCCHCHIEAWKIHFTSHNNNYYGNLSKVINSLYIAVLFVWRWLPVTQICSLQRCASVAVEKEIFHHDRVVVVHQLFKL